MANSVQRKFSCPVELTLEIVSGKWKPVILAHLKQGSLHYSELRALIPALSDKVLTQRLRDLEELGLVLRHKRGARGSRSRYELTARGNSLRPVLKALYDWGELIAPDVGALIEPPQQAANSSLSTGLSRSRKRPR
jgi:DNA-binding HxlR family transcriptional regulator